MSGFDLVVLDGAGPALAAAQVRFEERLLDVAQATAEALLDRARSNAENRILRDVTGAYVASLHVSLVERDGSIAVTLGSDAPEARILEYGGTTGPHDIRPKDAEVLAFLAGGGVDAVFAALVHDPGATIGPHPVLRTALAEVAGDAVTDCEALVALFGEAMS